MKTIVFLLLFIIASACQVKSSDPQGVLSSSAPSPYSTQITATTNILADGLTTSTITINVKKDGVVIAGEVPTFSATGSSNILGPCSQTDVEGNSTCTLKSTKAEFKSLRVLKPTLSPIISVKFIPGLPDATKTTITGTGPTVANGTSSSKVTITLKDTYNNFIPGITPTFSATDTGSTNNYGACSASNSSGISICSLKSTKAEVKTLNLLTPITKQGGTVIFNGGLPYAANSGITGTGPVNADGVASSTITITLKDSFNNPTIGFTPTFLATDTLSKNSYGPCSVTDTTGISTCSLKSLVGETKTLSLISPISIIGGTVVFNSMGAVANNSSIQGTGPVLANGVATSIITITLKDINNLPVTSFTPTFSATDTGSNNSYGTCSPTNTEGISTCSLSSLTAEAKTLSILTPVTKVDDTVIFTSPGAVAANSSISGTGPVIANGVNHSIISIMLKDSQGLPVPGETPTFTATDTNSTNIYGACSSTDSNGLSTCLLASTKAEIKTLTLVSPISKIDGIVIFTSDNADVANSTISGTGPVIADGEAASTISITLKDANNNPLIGETPTFSATDTDLTNIYGACSLTDNFGISTCTLKSSIPETKILSIVSPLSKADGSVVYTSAGAVAANSTITGSGPVIADGDSSSTITITLRDVKNNPVSGETPTFSATDTSSTNTYTTCSISDANGISTCLLKSTKAETKILSIATPIIKSGGSVIFSPGVPVPENSSIIGSGPVIANGISTSLITINLKDQFNNPVQSLTPTFSATDSSSTNSYGSCTATDAEGLSTCTLSSTIAESKTLSLLTPITKSDGNVEFIAGAAVAVNSSIAGTSDITADGVSTSTITITLKDASSNPIIGQIPTFRATNTGSTNIYNSCSLSNALGESVCSMTSTKAETKTLTIVTPILKSGGTVLFKSGSPDPLHSDISGTSPVSADGISVSFIMITLADAFNNPISGALPIYNATNTNTTNVYGACSITDESGISHCTLSSTKAELKTLQLTSPVAVTSADPITFSSSLPTSINSTIAGTGPVTADGVAESTITITLKDSNQNPVAGVTPTFDATDTDSLNSYDLCSMSDAGGISICTLRSLRAEAKTLRITNPVLKSGTAVIFTAGTAIVANSTISGSGPVIANGTSSSTVSIILKDTNNNPVIGTIPTFLATNTDNKNSYGACSPTDLSGTSQCSLKSTKAEQKIPQLLTPVNKSGSSITFIADSAAAENSTITGTGPVNPDGSSTSTITITLKDAFLNNVINTVPTFIASGSANILGSCSASDSNGNSTCTLASTQAETKTLTITSPVSKIGGTVIFQTGSAVAANCSIEGSGPIVADGIASSTVTISLKDSVNLPIVGIIPSFSASGSNNIAGNCTATNTSGISTCPLKSTNAETKTLQITNPLTKLGGTITFLPGSPSASTSTIVASGPVLANGLEQSTISISIRDAFGNAVPDLIPTFSMSGTSNTLSACTSSDFSGASTCAASSLKAEEKTFSLLSPVSVTGNSVDFNPNGINLQVPIEMVDRGLSSNTTATTFSRSRTSLNTLDYVAQSNLFMFEVIAENTSTTTAYTIYLVNNSGTQVTDSAITVQPSTPPTRFNVLWTPSIGQNDYRIKLPATPTTNVLKVHSAKMIVEQTAAVATKIYIPLAGGDTTGESTSDTSSAFVSSTASTSFVQQTSSNFNLWQRSDSSYDAIASGNAWTLETISTISNATATSSVALFDKINNQQIIEATTNVTGTTLPSFRQVSFSSSATNFNDGDTLELRLKSSSGSYNARLLKAGLWLKLRFLKKTDIYFRLANRRSASSSVAIADARFLWDEGAWSNPNVYFQTNANGTGSTLSLQDHGTNDSGTTTPTIIPGSLIVPTATYSVQRSGVLTLTDMNRYFVQHTRNTGTVVLGGAFILVRTHD
jgi:adhesin/invasin